MRRVMLTVAYDGTIYCGWQLQPGKETIESVLNRCLFELTGETIQVIGASRTDSGVHALGNIAVFDTESSIPAEKFSYLCDPGIILHRPCLFFGRRFLLLHGPEFIHMERLIMKPYPFLLKDHWSPAGKPHRQRHRQHYRGRKHNPQRRSQNIHSPFSHPV